MSFTRARGWSKLFEAAFLNRNVECACCVLGELGELGVELGPGLGASSGVVDDVER